MEWQTVANSGFKNTTANTCRYAMNGKISQQDLTAYYLKPWHAVVTEAHVKSIMHEPF